METILYLVRVLLSDVRALVRAERALKITSATVSTPETVTKINQIVLADRRMSIRMIAEAVNAYKETVKKILHEELHMTKVCAKLVPKNLTRDQKLLRQQVCSDFLERLEDPGLMKNIIICDETGIFQYDVETKRNRCIGRRLNRPE
ncbi:putative mariner transposase [Trichonephila clavipes]|nr:putative mariner transposase [Trichonephila clavipes]